MRHPANPFRLVAQLECEYKWYPQRAESSPFSSDAENLVAEPVRIAFVITELDVGGAERCLANLAAGIDRTRFAPLVCSLAPRPAEGQDSLVRQLEDASVPVHFLNLRSSLNFLSGWGKLKRFLRQHEIDVVQTFLFHANVLGALAVKSAGVSRIVSGIRVADPARWRMVFERFAMRRVDTSFALASQWQTSSQQRVDSRDRSFE